MADKYQICSKCIMDTSDPDIIFDKDGVCNHCYEYEEQLKAPVYVAKKQPGALGRLVDLIKLEGRRKEYDCVIGVSGGVDSTYVAYKVKQLGLRPLAVHLDNGWDSELAVDNIQKTLKRLDIDLYTNVLDWDEFRSLQLAFLRASTPDSEIPTDHAIIATLYMAAARYGTRFILSGHNTSTEGGGSPAWSQGHADWGYVKGVYEKITGKRLKKYPHVGLVEFAYYAILKRIKWIPFLDYFEYDKKEAMATIGDELSWRNYGGKHYESIYTRFYQGYILPKKFGFDKRRAHLSGLIWSGQLARAQALEQIAQNDYPQDLQSQDKEFVAKKLGLSSGEFEAIMETSPKKFWDYPSYKKIFNHHARIMGIYHRLKRG